MPFSKHAMQDRQMVTVQSTVFVLGTKWVVFSGLSTPSRALSALTPRCVNYLLSLASKWKHENG